MTITEEQLIAWSKPVSKTEDEKCQTAIKQITDVLLNQFGNDVEIFLQGSYQNNTNVRMDSDVDIVVKYVSVYYSDLYFLTEEQKKIYNSSMVSSDYTFLKFKDDVLLLL